MEHMEKQEMEMKRKLEMEIGSGNGNKKHTNHWCNVFFIYSALLLYHLLSNGYRTGFNYESCALLLCCAL